MVELVDKLQSENAKLVSENASLREQLEWCKRQIFGQKSERLVETPGEVDELPGLDVPPSADEPTPVTVPSHERRSTRGKGSCTLELPDHLERVEVLVDVPEAERTTADGTLLRRIGEDRSEKLAYRPGEYYARVTVRPKYADPTAPELGVLQEPMPGSLVEGSKFDPSFLAHVVVEKFAYHMPLYRLEEKLGTRGIRVTRQTLSQMVKTCGQRVVPLYELMISELFAQGVIFTDETPVKLQAKKKCREARVWVYVGGAVDGTPAYHIYQFTTDRSHRHPIAFLSDFRGTLHADAFGAYETLHNTPDNGINWAACWAHARRKFENASSGDPDLRLWVMRQMRKLFRYERVALARGPDQRLVIRRDREEPLVDELFQRLRAAVASGTLLPKAKLSDAIGYMLTREDNFRHYLSDPHARMDNNTAERALRKLTIGRKNWMFIGSEKAGHAMAALLSLTQTCRALGIDPQTYLEDIFTRLLDHPASQLHDLLPDRWAAARNMAQA